MSDPTQKQDALNYHEQYPPGKIAVIPTKEMSTQNDLALAYSPGVAEPCLEIADDPENVYKYTSKGNLVAVISNGTAVLGLGNIGAEASKPVMEGKGVLFKKFAGIDVFDIEINEEDPDKFIEIVKSLEPTFGGINLEDIKAPESFKIEQELISKLSIPVMHDDQHGTAIISAAALLNALDITRKKIEKIKVAVSGAGASATACLNLYLKLGMKKENIVICDSKGVVRKDRSSLTPEKEIFATDQDLHTLSEAVQDADFFLGLSKGDVMTPEMLESMADNPIVFALANPNPEIAYDLALQTRDDVIMATGRSDHPNQVNNVLGFPYIFRGALDVRAKTINEEMKLAAVKALAELAKEEVPDMVRTAYDDSHIKYGPFYLIPKPLDPRLITWVSTAVAKAAMKSGVARKEIKDWDKYKKELRQKIGLDDRIVSGLISRAKRSPKRVVFAEADNYKILKAAHAAQKQGYIIPILMGNKEKIINICESYSLDPPKKTQIIDVNKEEEKRHKFGEILYKKRQRKGLTLHDCNKLMLTRNYFAAMMVETGEADAVISGLTKDYPSTLKPALQIIGVSPQFNKASGMYIILSKKGIFFFADTTVQVNPDAEDLVNIIGMSAQLVKNLHFDPKIAVLSYSNFGSATGPVPEKVRKAVEMAKERYPDLVIDGDIQANVALNKEILNEMYEFSTLSETGANTFVFPDLTSVNIAYKMVMELGDAQAIGPILMGLNKPYHVLQLGSSVRQIMNMAAIAVVHAQMIEKSKA